jgi:hypothetical protein
MWNRSGKTKRREEYNLPWILVIFSEKVNIAQWRKIVNKAMKLQAPSKLHIYWLYEPLLFYKEDSTQGLSSSQKGSRSFGKIFEILAAKMTQSGNGRYLTS